MNGNSNFHVHCLHAHCTTPVCGWVCLILVSCRTCIALVSIIIIIAIGRASWYPSVYRFPEVHMISLCCCCCCCCWAAAANSTYTRKPSVWCHMHHIFTCEWDVKVQAFPHLFSRFLCIAARAATAVRLIFLSFLLCEISLCIVGACTPYTRCMCMVAVWDANYFWCWV